MKTKEAQLQEEWDASVLNLSRAVESVIGDADKEATSIAEVLANAWPAIVNGKATYYHLLLSWSSQVIYSSSPECKALQISSLVTNHMLKGHPDQGADRLLYKEAKRPMVGSSMKSCPRVWMLFKTAPSGADVPSP